MGASSTTGVDTLLLYVCTQQQQHLCCGLIYGDLHYRARLEFCPWFKHLDASRGLLCPSDENMEIPPSTEADFEGLEWQRECN